MQHKALIAVGRLTKPHGLRGEIVFLPYVIDMVLLPNLAEQAVILQHRMAPTLTRTVLAWRQFHKRVLLQLADCEDITQAEAFRDYEVLIPRQLFPPLPEGEYYWFEIEGLSVYARDGRALGTIAEIIHTGSNDVYVVQDEGHEVLVPALKQTVRSIDLQGGEMHLFVLPDEL